MVNKPVTRLSTLWSETGRRAGELARGPIARASALSLGIRISGLALTFVQAILTARLLGPAGYGTVAAVLSVVQVLAMIGIFGLGSLAVREIPAGQADDRGGRVAGFLRLSLLLTLSISCILAALAGFAVIPAMGSASADGQVLAFAAVLVIPLALLGLFRGWAQGFGRIGNAQIPAEVLRPAIMVAAMLGALGAGLAFSERDYLLVTVGSAIIAMLVSLAMLWRSDLRELPSHQQSADLQDTVKAALPFVGLGIAATLQGEINTLLLAALATPEETGLFQPIARIAPLLVLPVQAAGMRYAPRIAELWRKGERERIVAITRTFTWTTTLLTLLLGLAIALAGPWLLLAFGEEFVDAAPLLWIIAAAQLFNAACGPVGMILTMTDHARLALSGNAAGLAVNGLLGWLLIPDWGILGAALGMAAGIVTWNLAMLVAAARTAGIKTSILELMK